MNIQSITLTMSDRTKMQAQSWLPDVKPKGIIVLSHGYGEHLERYKHVCDYFTQQGYALCGMDHRGHGQNRGNSFGYFERFELLRDDLGQVIAWAIREHPGRAVFLLGHSMGGELALSYAEAYQSTLKGLIVSASLLPTYSEFSPFQQSALRLLGNTLPRFPAGPRVDPATLSRDTAVTSAYTSDPLVYTGQLPARVAVEMVKTSEEVRANLKRINLPILIMHGSGDRLVKGARGKDG